MKQKGISVLTGGAYKLFRRPHLLRLSSLLCRFSFPHLPYCIPATHILRPFVQKVRYVNRICFSRSEEHTSELQSHRDLHSFPTRRSSDLALQIQLPPSPLLHSSYSYTEAFRAESQICQPHLLFRRTHQYCLPLESKVCTSGHRLCSLRRVCSGQAGSSGLRSLPVFPDNKRRLDRVQDVHEG